MSPLVCISFLLCAPWLAPAQLTEMVVPEQPTEETLGPTLRLLATRLGQLPSSDSLQRLGLSLTLSTPSSSFKNGAPWELSATIKNLRSLPQQLVLANSPFDPKGIRANVFTTRCISDSCSGKTARYTGLELDGYFGGFPAAELLELQPEEQSTARINLGDYLEFDRSGVYQLRLAWDLKLVNIRLNQPPNAGNEPQHYAVSDPIEMRVVFDAALPPPRSEPERVQQSPPAGLTAHHGGPLRFVGCSDSEKEAVAHASVVAKRMADNAVNLIQRKRYPQVWKDWFGDQRPLFESPVTLALQKVRAILASGRWQVHCKGMACTSDEIFAYVAPSDTVSHRVYLCSNGGFFSSAAIRAKDSQPGTIIHELVLFSDILGAGNYAYDTGSLGLAIRHPAVANRNADSVERYTEDSRLPFQNANGQALPPAPPGHPIPASDCVDDSNCLAAYGWQGYSCASALEYAEENADGCSSYEALLSCCRLACLLCSNPGPFSQ